MKTLYCLDPNGFAVCDENGALAKLFISSLSLSCNNTIFDKTQNLHQKPNDSLPKGLKLCMFHVITYTRARDQLAIFQNTK